MRRRVLPRPAALIIGAGLAALVLTAPTALAITGAASPALATTARATTGPASTSSWLTRHAPLPPEVTAFAALSCGTPRSCLAIGGTAATSTVLLRSSNGGLRWTEHRIPARLGSFTSVSCVGALRCMATIGPADAASPSGVATTTDGGRSWHADAAIPSAGNGFWGPVQCVSASVCFVINEQASSYRDGGIERTSDFGRHWTTEHVSGARAKDLTAVDAVTCASPADCVAISQWRLGGDVSPAIQTGDGGATWTIRVLPKADQDLNSVSCDAARDCLAVGGTGTAGSADESSNGGVTWRAVHLPRALAAAYGADCTVARACVAVGEIHDGRNGGIIASTSDLGQHWVVTTRTHGTGFFDNVSCPSAAHCVVGRESNGNIAPSPAGSVGWLVSSDGGASWRPAGLPLELADLQGVACPTASVCFASGGTAGPANDAVVLRSDTVGRSWRIVLKTRRAQSLASISCPTTRHCVAVGSLNFGTGDTIARTSDGGRHWRVTAAPAAVAALADVSCPATDACEAIGYAAHGKAPTRLLRSVDGGAHWRVRRAPRGVAYLLDLACATARTCTAVGDPVRTSAPASIERTTDGGAHWTSRRPPRDTSIIDSVACPDIRTCYAFSDSWPGIIDATRDGGASWHRQRLPRRAAGLLLPPTQLACATDRRCAGVATDPVVGGVVFETANAGSSWRIAALPSGTEWLLGVACLRHRCIAVGLDGQIVDSAAPWRPARRGGLRPMAASRGTAGHSALRQIQTCRRSAPRSGSRIVCQIRLAVHD